MATKTETMTAINDGAYKLLGRESPLNRFYEF